MCNTFTPSSPTYFSYFGTNHIFIWYFIYFQPIFLKAIFEYRNWFPFLPNLQVELSFSLFWIYSGWGSLPIKSYFCKQIPPHLQKSSQHYFSGTLVLPPILGGNFKTGSHEVLHSVWHFFISLNWYLTSYEVAFSVPSGAFSLRTWRYRVEVLCISIYFT